MQDHVCRVFDMAPYCRKCEKCGANMKPTFNKPGEVFCPNGSCSEFYVVKVVEAKDDFWGRRLYGD